MRTWLTERLASPWLRLSIRAKGVVLIALPLAVLLLTLFSFAYLQQQQEEAERWAFHTQQVQVKGRELLSLLVDGQGAVRGYALSGREEFLNSYYTAERQIPIVLAQLRQLVLDNPAQVKRLDELEPLVRERLGLMRETRDLASTGNVFEPNSPQRARLVDDLDRTRMVMRECRSHIAALQSEEDRLLDLRMLQLGRQRRLTWLTFLISALVAVAGGWTTTGMFASGITSRLVALGENARRLAQRDSLLPIVAGADEINSLDQELHRTAALLREGEARIQELNRDLSIKVEDLAASNQELEAFTYSVAHDLRTPLRHIHGFAALLVEDYGAQLAAEARGYLDHISRGTANMGRLIDDLLNLSRVGRQAVVPQPVGLGKRVAAVREQVEQEESAERAIRFEIGELPFVECDPGLMRQVFQNLLANAIKFTRLREQAVIEVGATRANGETTVFVRDNGVGFNMKYADKLFGVFQRLHRQEDFEGTGVGLATVQRIVRKHGGRVWAEAQLDQGATFYFTLPAVDHDPDHLAPVPGADQRNAKEAYEPHRM